MRLLKNKSGRQRMCLPGVACAKALGKGLVQVTLRGSLVLCVHQLFVIPPFAGGYGNRRCVSRNADAFSTSTSTYKFNEFCLRLGHSSEGDYAPSSAVRRDSSCSILA